MRIRKLIDNYLFNIDPPSGFAHKLRKECIPRFARLLQHGCWLQFLRRFFSREMNSRKLPKSKQAEFVCKTPPSEQAPLPFTQVLNSILKVTLETIMTEYGFLRAEFNKACSENLSMANKAII